MRSVRSPKALRPHSSHLLESLETRQLLSVTLDDRGVLHVKAEEGVASRIVVAVRGNAGDDNPTDVVKGQAVTVHVNGKLMGTFRNRAVRALRVVGSALNDSIDSKQLDRRPTTVLALAGDDRVAIGDGRSLILGGAGNDALSGGDRRNLIRGGEGNDVIAGGRLSDFLGGGPGDDKIFGGAGRDAIFGRAGNDELAGGDGDDLVHGGSGDDLIHGGLGDDFLFGGLGNDSIRGGEGDDWLFGGQGTDLLDGGPGDDRIFQGGPNGEGDEEPDTEDEDTGDDL